MRAGRKGSALLVVLATLVGVLSLLATSQALLRGRTVSLRMEETVVELRGALLLGLTAGMAHWQAEGEADWEPVREFRADNGVAVRLRLTDAQGRLDLNSVPGNAVLEEGLVRMLGALGFAGAGPAVRAWAGEAEAGAVALGSVEAWPTFLPEAGEWLSGEAGAVLRSWVTVLPPRAAGVRPINLNSVDGGLLGVLLGRELAGWVDAVLAAREEAPIQSLGTVMGLLPGPVARTLNEVFGVQSDWRVLEVVGERDLTEGRLMALLTRDAEGNVEVVSCRW